MKKITLALILAGALAITAVVASRDKIASAVYNMRKAAELTLPTLAPKKDSVTLTRDLNQYGLNIFYREKDGIRSASITNLTTGNTRDITSELSSAKYLGDSQSVKRYEFSREGIDGGLDKAVKYQVIIVDRNGKKMVAKEN